VSEDVQFSGSGNRFLGIGACRPHGTHPFGVKAVAEIPLDGVAPAGANAVYDATGVQVPAIPLMPETAWRALQGKHAAGWWVAAWCSQDAERSLPGEMKERSPP
jgi:hypothetical protein